MPHDPHIGPGSYSAPAGEPIWKWRIVMTQPNVPGRALPTGGTPPAGAREHGLRQLRHLSNWTLAALVAGVGVTTALLEQAATRTATAPPATAPATTARPAATGTAPHVSTPVATTTASGVVVPAASSGAAGRAPVNTSGHAAWGGDS